MQEIKSVKDAYVAGKRVLVRLNFDVPLQDGKVKDDERLRAGIPTLNYLREQGATVTVIAHAGRPGGGVIESLRLAPIVARLGELTDVTGFVFQENLRFDPREEANDAGFAKELAVLGDVYVNDAFADAHRAHASIVGIPKYLPSYAGLHFLDEIQHLSHALAPAHPALAIVGGAKPETKIPLIEKFAGLYEKVLVGGALANGYVPAKENILLPIDGLPALKGMFDIGEQTRVQWGEEIVQAAFVLWNGPVGMYEKPEFSGGTDVLAGALVKSGCRAVIGGGDTIAAVSKFTFDQRKVFISSGGGAMLQFLADGTLPGIEALKNSPTVV